MVILSVRTIFTSSRCGVPSRRYSPVAVWRHGVAVDEGGEDGVWPW